MKINTIVKTVLAASILAATGAQAYQVELNGNYNQYSVDGSNADTDVYGVNAKYYIDPVKVGSNPLEEAAFLNKASNVEIAYGKVNADGSSNDTDVVGLGGEAYLKQSPVYLAAKYANVDNGKDKDDVFSAKVGYLPAATSRVTVGLVRANGETDPTIGAKYVGSTGTNTFNLEADAVFADDTGFRLAGDFYVDPSLSLGVSYADKYAGLNTVTSPATVIATAEKVVGVNAKKYFTPQFAVGVNYAKGEVDNVDVDGFGIELTGRF